MGMVRIGVIVPHIHVFFLFFRVSRVLLYTPVHDAIKFISREYILIR